MIIKRSYPIFTTTGGDHFVFPGLFDSPDEDKFVTWSETATLARALGVSLTKPGAVVEFDRSVDDVLMPHVRVSMGHRSFAHGSEDVLLIGGPMFDKAVQEATQ